VSSRAEIAQRVLDAKRNVDWLELVLADARSRRMAVLSIAIASELRLQRSKFWLASADLGVGLSASAEEIRTVTRRIVAGVVE
jgi:hypothetical protein